MAYEVLSNPEKRKLYDQAGEQGIKEGGSGGGGGMNPMDIFDMFFGGGGGDPFGRGGGFGRQRGPRRTKNLVHQLSVSLEDMYNGTTRKLALQKNVICDACEGLGGKAGAVQKCPNCRDSGMQVRIQQLGPGMMQQIQSMCGECHGEGERVDPKLRCKKCNGRKVNRERKILEVSVDKGMEDGQKVTFSGEGDQEPGLEPGDIIIVLDEKAHALFKRNGQDLIMKMDISLTEALTGLKKAVKTLDDRTLVIQTVRGEVIKSGDLKMVRGEGMPQYRNPFEKGRLIIQFNVVFPPSLEPSVAENLHPYCHLRTSLSSLTKLTRWTSTISTQRQTDSNNITEWATGISTTMTKAITDILEALAFSVPHSRQTATTSQNGPRAFRRRW